MITEVFIENKRLDITADISSLLTFALDDVKDFSSRQTTFSKTIVLPGTAINNRIFNLIFQTGADNDHNNTLPNVGTNFTPSKGATCNIFQDYIQTFKGVLRLLEITYDNGRPEYQVSVSGDMTTLNAALAGSFLSDLNFSAYNQLWNVANIVGSWDNTPGSGVYFPMIDYGTYGTVKHDWNFRTFRPACYVKEYIDKIFAAAGFRYNSALFNTSRFKRLIVPTNTKDLTKLTSKVLTASDTTTFKILDHALGAFENDAQFNTHVGAQFPYSEVAIDAFTSRRFFTYTGADTISTTLAIHLEGYYNFAIGANLNVQITIKKNGSTYYTDPVLLNANAGRDIHYTKDYSIPVVFATGDYVEVHYSLGGTLSGGAHGEVYIQNPTLSVTSSSTVQNPLDYNEMIDMSFVIPKNIKQIDFLKSIVQLFNLYVYEDKYDNRLINISPFVDFYFGNSVTDWTGKMNRAGVISIKPMSEINSKLYKFNYASDSDYYNDLYNKRYNQVYGSYVFDSQFDFATSDNTLTLIFASTPLVGYLGQDKIYPTILKISGTTEDRVDSVIRIMQSRKMYGVASWNILSGTESGTVLSSNTAYGYAGHYDDPGNPDNDLNFGGLFEAFYAITGGTLDRTQFNLYWSAYMAEITNKDSKLLSAKFKLDPPDILNLDFAKFIYLDGVLWRLNKIIDYNATMPSDCTVELLKVINTAYSYPIGSIPESLRTLDWETGDDIEYSPGNALLYE